MSQLDGSIVLIALPAIFTGIRLEPLEPQNVGFLLWMLMGYRLVQAVLVVTVGRLGDMFGRVRIYNAGFLVFTLAGVALSFDPWRGSGGAIWLILLQHRAADGLGKAPQASTYGIQPDGGHVMGWANPWVLTGLIGGAVALIAFLLIERRMKAPMVNLALFRIRAFSAGNLAGFTASLARGGLQFMIVIWL